MTASRRLNKSDQIGAMQELAETTNTTQPHLIVVGEFLIDHDTIRVWRGDKPLQISLRQFRLLDVFMQHPGKPISRTMLKDLVWGADSTIEEATIDVEIGKLRRAIGGRRREGPIRTIRGLGYVFQPPKRRQSANEFGSSDVKERL